MTTVLEHVGLFQFGFCKLNMLIIPLFVVSEMKGMLQFSKKIFLHLKESDY